MPNLDLSSGWEINENDNSDIIELRFRNAQPISPSQWSVEFGDILDGWYVIQHSIPVPSEWLESLNNEGYECFSYIPHGAFHCLITSTPVQDLIDLEVQGIMMLDPTDKVHPMIDELLEGEFEHGYTIFGKGIVTIVLSGDSIPELQFDESLRLLSHSNRWATLLAVSYTHLTLPTKA